jgi:hypothetical protein
MVTLPPKALNQIWQRSIIVLNVIRGCLNRQLDEVVTGLERALWGSLEVKSPLPGPSMRTHAYRSALIYKLLHPGLDIGRGEMIRTSDPLHPMIAKKIAFLYNR